MTSYEVELIARRHIDDRNQALQALHRERALSISLAQHIDAILSLVEGRDDVDASSLPLLYDDPRLRPYDVVQKAMDKADNDFNEMEQKYFVVSTEVVDREEQIKALNTRIRELEAQVKAPVSAVSSVVSTPVEQVSPNIDSEGARAIQDAFEQEFKKKFEIIERWMAFSPESRSEIVDQITADVDGTAGAVVLCMPQLSEFLHRTFKQLNELANALAVVQQSTQCASCHIVKHTPCRMDEEFDGYVCAGCMEKRVVKLREDLNRSLRFSEELASILRGVSKPWETMPETAKRLVMIAIIVDQWRQSASLGDRQKFVENLVQTKLFDGKNAIVTLLRSLLTACD